MSNHALRFYQSLALAPWLAALVPLLMLTHLPLVVLAFSALEAHVFVALAFRRYTRSLRRQEQSPELQDIRLEALALVIIVCARAKMTPPRHIKITPSRLARYDALADVIEVSIGLLDGARIDSERAQAVIAHELGHRAQHSRFWSYLGSFIGVFTVFVAPLCLLLSGTVIGSIIVAAQSVVLFAIMIPLDRYGSRRIESDADAYAAALGYGPALIRQLSSREDSPTQPLLRSHPSASKRVHALVS